MHRIPRPSRKPSAGTSIRDHGGGWSLQQLRGASEPHHADVNEAVRAAWTNVYSKKFENHVHMTSLYFLCYSFCRIHQSIGCTSTMEAGLTDTLHDVEWIAELATPTPLVDLAPCLASTLQYVMFGWLGRSCHHRPWASSSGSSGQLDGAARS